MSHKTAVLALQHKPAPPSVLKIREEWKSHISEWVIPREAGNGHLLPFYGGLMNGHGQPLKNSTQVKCNEGPQSSAQIWSSWRGREMGRGRATEQNDYISLCFDSYYNKKKIKPLMVLPTHHHHCQVQGILSSQTNGLIFAKPLCKTQSGIGRVQLSLLSYK